MEHRAPPIRIEPLVQGVGGTLQVPRGGSSKVGMRVVLDLGFRVIAVNEAEASAEAGEKLRGAEEAVKAQMVLEGADRSAVARAAAELMAEEAETRGAEGAAARQVTEEDVLGAAEAAAAARVEVAEQRMTTCAEPVAGEKSAGMLREVEDAAKARLSTEKAKRDAGATAVAASTTRDTEARATKNAAAR